MHVCTERKSSTSEKFKLIPSKIIHYWLYDRSQFFRSPRIEATKYAIRNGTEFIWSNKTIEWTYQYFIFAVDDGTPKRGDRIPLTISFNATCQESGGIFVNGTSGEVFFRAPGLTVSEYRKLLDINYGCFFFTVCCRQYCLGRLGVLLIYYIYMCEAMFTS